MKRLDASSANSLNDAVAHLKLGRALLREGRFAEAEPESLIGYRYLTKQVTPSDRFLKFVRSDLAAIETALHKNADAARYRAELDAAVPAKH